MDFTLTPEQELIRRTCRDFAQQVIAPRAEEMDRTASFPYDIVEQMARLGLMGLPCPEEYGGAGADTVSYALAVEALRRRRACPDWPHGTSIARGSPINHRERSAAPLHYLTYEEVCDVA
jgi:butyryl-CoA dehydrogenase